MIANISKYSLSDELSQGQAGEKIEGIMGEVTLLKDNFEKSFTEESKKRLLAKSIALKNEYEKIKTKIPDPEKYGLERKIWGLNSIFEKLEEEYDRYGGEQALVKERMEEVKVNIKKPDVAMSATGDPDVQLANFSLASNMTELLHEMMEGADSFIPKVPNVRRNSDLADKLIKEKAEEQEREEEERKRQAEMKKNKGSVKYKDVKRTASSINQRNMQNQSFDEPGLLDRRGTTDTSVSMMDYSYEEPTMIAQSIDTMEMVQSRVKELEHRISICHDNEQRAELVQQKMRLIATAKKMIGVKGFFTWLFSVDNPVLGVILKPLGVGRRQKKTKRQMRGASFHSLASSTTRNTEMDSLARGSVNNSTMQSNTDMISWNESTRQDESGVSYDKSSRNNTGLNFDADTSQDPSHNQGVVANYEDLVDDKEIEQTLNSVQSVRKNFGAKNGDLI